MTEYTSQPTVGASDPLGGSAPQTPSNPASQRCERPFRALLWDMDGLLVDSEPLWYLVERDFAKRRGGDFTKDLAAENIGKGIRHTIDLMRRLFGFEIDVDKGVDELISNFMARTGELSLKPGARELLAFTHGRYALALASSSHRHLIEKTLDQFGVRSLFGAIVSGQNVANPKPAPDIFLRAAELLGVPIGECVVLEDSIAGATAGRAAGAIVVAVPEGPPDEFPFAEVADVVVPDLFAAARFLGFS